MNELVKEMVEASFQAWQDKKILEQLEEQE